MIFYWSINLGAVSLIASPFIEKSTGFWAAFLMCFGAFNIAIVILILILARRKYVVRPPQGGVIIDAFKAIGLMIKTIFRISVGFTLAGLSLAYAAIVQHLIYSAGPCYDHPSYNLADEQHYLCPNGFDAEGNDIPDNVHIAVQTPAYMLLGIAEIYISVTGLEHAFTKAPANMKSFVQSIYLFTNAFGAALNAVLVPVLVDPKILWMYTGVGVTSVVTAFVCRTRFSTSTIGKRTRCTIWIGISPDCIDRGEGCGR